MGTAAIEPTTEGLRVRCDALSWSRGCPPHPAPCPPQVRCSGRWPKPGIALAAAAGLPV